MKNGLRKSVGMKPGVSAFSFYFVGIKEHDCFQCRWIELLVYLSGMNEQIILS